MNYHKTTRGRHVSQAQLHSLPYYKPRPATCSSLQSLVQENKRYPIDVLANWIFNHFLPTTNTHSPQIYNKASITSYIRTLLMATNATNQILLATIQYIKRLSTDILWFQRQDITLLFTGSLMLAYKMLEDSPYFTNSWAPITCFDAVTLNRAERLLANKLEYKLSVVENEMIQDWLKLNYFCNNTTWYRPNNLIVHHQQHTYTSGKVTRRQMNPHYIRNNERKRSQSISMVNYQPNLTYTNVPQNCISFHPQNGMLNLPHPTLLPPLTIPSMVPKMEYCFKVPELITKWQPEFYWHGFVQPTPTFVNNHNLV